MALAACKHITRNDPSVTDDLERLSNGNVAPIFERSCWSERFDRSVDSARSITWLKRLTAGRRVRDAYEPFKRGIRLIKHSKHATSGCFRVRYKRKIPRQQIKRPSQCPQVVAASRSDSAPRTQTQRTAKHVKRICVASLALNRSQRAKRAQLQEKRAVTHLNKTRGSNLAL